MGKNWDKAVPSVEIWQECLRVLKPGAFICVMSAPRSDVQMHMIQNISKAGFRVDFTPIYWTYASGFPKAGNIGKLVDKRGGVLLGREFCELIKSKRLELGFSKTELAALGGFHGAVNHGGSVSNWEEGRGTPTLEQYNKLLEILQLDAEKLSPAEREIIGRQTMTFGIGGSSERLGGEKIVSKASSDQAKALDGSYTGFQPKPAVEVIIVAMKPLSEKTYVDQALKNGKGISWLDDCRLPGAELKPHTRGSFVNTYEASKTDWGAGDEYIPSTSGRFPANLLVSDDVLNDGTTTKSTGGKSLGAMGDSVYGKYGKRVGSNAGGLGDSGSYSRYFNLDRWASTLPFLIVPKASKSEKNKGLEHFNEVIRSDRQAVENIGANNPRNRTGTAKKNHHPTVKPLKLMSYLITLFSREGDIILDPFVGSGTTVIAAKQLQREAIGIEFESEYAEIATARLAAVDKLMQMKLV